MNWVLQEQFRATLHRLPFCMIPRVMIVKLALRVTRTENFFPAKDGISKHHETATTISGRQVDFNKELVFSLGDYVQAYADNKPKNNDVRQTKDAICLQASNTLQQGQEVCPQLARY